MKPSFLSGEIFGLAGVAYAQPEMAPQAHEIAQELGLSTVLGADAIEEPGQDWALWLVVEPQRLLLRPMGSKAPGPVTLDFLQKDRLYRFQNAQHERKQPLGKAIGISKGTPRVLDATAGLGADTQMFLAWGCQVTAIERSPVLVALWKKALSQVQGHPVLQKPFEGLEFRAIDAIEHLASAPNPFDVVYLDPMYPQRKRASVAVKKEMQVFRHLVGDDEDASELLALGLKHARQRVVVKRPKHAPTLGDREPNFQVKGTVVRFDVYLSG